MRDWLIFKKGEYRYLYGEIYKTPLKKISVKAVMLEVKVPSEIRAYKGKLVAGLSVRQVISVAGSLVVGVPLGVFGGKIIPPDILMWAVIITVAPIIAWGFAKFKGMRFEEAVNVLFKFFALPQKRVYEDTEVNYFSHVRTSLCVRDIVQQRIDNGETDEDEVNLEQEEMKDYVF